MKATVQTAALREYRRVLAISDIHGNLAYFEALLKKVGFCEQDALVLVGDLIEKGPENLGVVRRVMQLARKGNVWAVAGNCDRVTKGLLQPENAGAMQKYMQDRRADWQGYSILWEMCEEAGLAELAENDPAEFQRTVLQKYAAEIGFLNALPTILQTEDCLFVHAGVQSEDLSDMEEWPCLKTKAFARTEGPRFEKTVVVGHWPVVLYSSGIARANPIYNAGRNIFSIDGSCMLKYDAQLNCLIRNNVTDCWSFECYDAFRTARALTPQSPSTDPFLFLYGDDEAEILYKEGSLSRCRHRRTGREMDVPTELLWKDESGVVHVDNCGDYRLPVRSGDVLSVVMETEKGYIVKKDGVSGWYCGTVEYLE